MRIQSRVSSLIFPVVVPLLSAFLWSLAPAAASGVGMWSRRYGVPCGYCHAYPSLQLTAEGADFFRRGHRVENDSWDKNITHLISAHGEWEWDVAQRQPTSFQSPELHIHVGGALTKAFSAYVDANVAEGLETAYLQYTNEWGKESYFTARAGKISPTIIRNYGNGLMASASTPLILTDTTLADNPFTPARDSFGIDLAARWKSIFVQTGVVNGEDVEGQAAVNDHKDFFATGEFALPDGLSGVGLYYYRGGYSLGDPTVAAFADKYDRKGIFANFTRDRFRVAGAYLYGKDEVATMSDRKIHGWYAQTDFRATPWLVPFIRWDDVTTETDEGKERIQKGNIGVSIRLFEFEVTSGRVVLEGSRQREGRVYTTAGLFNVLWMW